MWNPVVKIVVADDLPASALDLLRVEGWAIDARSGRAPDQLAADLNDADAITKVSGGALTREDRFDGMVFIDLPSRPEKDVIWRIWREHFHIDESQQQPNDDGWTGAEIKACCRKALMYELALHEAAAYVTHVDPEQVEALRSWADWKRILERRRLN